MNILAVDTGFGDVKVVYGDNNSVKNIFKFPSAVAQVEKNALVNDVNLIEHEGRSFYVGEAALGIQNSAIIDISDYSRLEKATPLFLLKAIKDLDISLPDIIVLGLSIAQVANSGYYKETVENLFKGLGKDVRVIVLPQGAASKLTIDRYGATFPQVSKDFNPQLNYVLCDIGFNTLDVCHVVNGKTSANMLRGIEKQGAIVIASTLVEKIKEAHGLNLTVNEARQILNEGSFKRRGVSYEVASFIKEAKLAYIENLKVIIEDQFGDILDKVDNLFIVGGGAYFLSDITDPFFKIPKEQAEYYNAVGYYLFGLKQPA